MDLRTGSSARPSLSETFMRVAEVMAERSTCPDGARHGAVIAVDDYIVSTGYGSPAAGVPPCAECWLRKKFKETGVKDWSVCPSVHAEVNALAAAARIGCAVGSGSIVYLTKTPCQPCARLLLNANVLSYAIRFPSQVECFSVKNLVEGNKTWMW